MLPILFVTTTYDAPSDDTDDYLLDGESDCDTLQYGFRELVRGIQSGGYLFPSSSVPTVADITAHDWLTTKPNQDYRTGGLEERSIHLDASATPHQLRYWRLAWKAAGLVK